MLRIIAALSLVATLAASPASGSGPIRDPNFEAEGAAGAFGPWRDCGSVPAVLEHDAVLHGHPAVMLGSPAGGEIAGDAGVCQQVRVPMARHVFLDYWARASSTEPDATHAYAEVAFYDGTTVPDKTQPYLVLVHDVVNTNGGFQHFMFDISQLAGQTLYLSFGVHGDGNPAAHTSFVLENVSLPVEDPMHADDVK